MLQRPIFYLFCFIKEETPGWSEVKCLKACPVEL